MTPREMFEKLGYEQTINDGNFIFYEKVEAERFHTRIVFGFKTRSFSASYWINGHYAGEGHYVKLDEFKAIEQQMKELGWLEEEKAETNYEHFRDEIIEIINSHLALVNGEPRNCSRIDCSYCDFNRHGGCDKKVGEVEEWLKQPYKKPTYKLSQFEFDLIQTFDRCKECCLLNEIECLKKLTQKGYFNGIDPFTKVHEILDNCEVIK